MCITFKTEREYDRHTPKISYLEIQKSEKSLNLCPKIVLWEVPKKHVWFHKEN
jgi:hypothetical protein